MATLKTTEEPDFIQETPYVESMSTLKVRIFKSFKTEAGFYYLQFLKIATDKNPLCTHWYCRCGDLTDPYGHMDLLLRYAVSETCASCSQSETVSSWICCPLCSE